ncbi:MAG: hypothetical protein KY459_12970 [Acidobacteria bacterium]|nr:hypothetical protein [Acidobacteriota bacterium]
MGQNGVEGLREELRERGYLRRGLERWFAHDPWSSRKFWSELLIVSAKAGIVIALFASFTMSAALSLRNDTVGASVLVIPALLYLLVVFALVVAGFIVGALLLRTRVQLAVDEPRILTLAALAVAAAVAGLILWWWSGFRGDATPGGLIVFVSALVATFASTAVVVSAALLSFSIHETGRIPALHRRSWTGPLITGGVILGVLVLFLAFGDGQDATAVPDQIVVHPSDARLALIAVDGLSFETADLADPLKQHFRSFTRIGSGVVDSPAERWADIGTGTDSNAHQVRSIEGVQFAGSRFLQNVPPSDFVLRSVAPALGLAASSPLPPSARNRDYVWEILADRGIPVVAVNWWTAESAAGDALTSVAQADIHTRLDRASSPAARATEIDDISLEELMSAAVGRQPRFVTVYLPGLDIAFNRLEIDDRALVAVTLQTLDRLTAVTTSLRALGYDVILLGVPARGVDGVLASTLDLDSEPESLADVAPTILDLFGFPASHEMRGDSMVGSGGERISSYGARSATESSGEPDDDYYESLRSLGYL